MVSQPIFLVGSERSGTTLLRLMLDHHSCITFTHEFSYAVEYMPDEDHWLDLMEFHRLLDADRVFRATGFTADEALDYPHLVDSFLRQRRDRSAKPIVGAVVHHHFDRLTRIWPDARFVHIVRDGRDVARSFIEMGWAGNMYTAVEGWMTAENLWAKMRLHLEAERWIDVYYEALIREPEDTLRQICGVYRSTI